MEMHRELRTKKVLQSTIQSAEFNSITTNNKITKAIRYIYGNNLWERCHVLLKIIFPCLRFIRLADSNHEVMENVYYYSRITKQCIYKTVSDIDDQKLLPDINSPANIWNMYDYESD